MDKLHGLNYQIVGDNQNYLLVMNVQWDLRWIIIINVSEKYKIVSFMIVQQEFVIFAEMVIPTGWDYVDSVDALIQIC